MRHGVIVVDKPAGLTSAGIVARVRRAMKHVGVKKIGHTGTLDPIATGVLPLVLGEATKLAGHLLADEKSYEATLELGVETDTHDSTGAVTARAEVHVTRAQLEAAMRAFVGAIEQVPPMYSAIKHQGRSLHELAREGAEIDRAPRTITIHRLELLAFEGTRATIAIDCTKGTYVRVLIADLGRALGCGAHMTALRRTRSGPFTLADALPLAELERDPRAAVARVLSPARALGLPSFAVAEPDVLRVLNGIVPPDLAAKLPESQLVQLVTPAGELLALTTGPRLVRVFTYGLTEDPRSSKVPART